ncbi:hypothetical protein UPYG_G00227640 [Umbra pygmaea]|uniref:Ig-like domain-containing protein n=1 Tax=Umbra pygmaea TaxID=75934 RepID=A0ABD0WDP7_UMBPY
MYSRVPLWNTDKAEFGSGTRLTVLETGVNITKPTVKVLPPSPQEGKGRKKKKTLVCVASDFYPDHVTVSWKINNQTHIEGVATDDQAKQDDDTRKYSITSRLRVNTRDWNKASKTFTCTVNFFDGNNTIPVSDSINGDELEGEGLTAETYVKRTQTGKLVYIVLIAKSTFYGLVVMVLVWKLKGSSGKHFN